MANELTRIALLAIALHAVGARAQEADTPLIVSLSGAPALSEPLIVENQAPAKQFKSVFALRYWYGFDSTSKDLYGLTRDTFNSRLTYDGMQTHSLEAYARVDHSSGLFWKGYAGGGLLTRGNLQDEDFPPGITPYSSTNSTLQNQPIGYLSTDFGRALLRGPTFRLDGFVGYHYFHQRMKAFGCHQTASNPNVCAGGISNSVGVIAENSTWQGLRLGLNADFPIVDRWRVDLEGAWLPYVRYSGTDSHLLRPDIPIPIRQDGRGWGYQLEAILSYQVDNAISVSVGGRYWHMRSEGYAHFEDLGGSPQPLDFKVDNYGVFLQASYRFGAF